MKITEMHLDDFGIYHGVSWNPPEHGLIVMHGRNESGKTTLMKYVRSMFFGYLRGDWKGYFGSMGIRREDGKEYRIVRNEKEYFLSDGSQKVQDEPADLWWHGLDRQTYDKIFAMGLEDLQGFKILSNEAVRSHFFSIEGGVSMGMARSEVTKHMGDLLVASPQGKKPINSLLNEQKDFDRRINGMAYDEDEFASLQETEQTTHEIENRIRLDIEESKQQIERISMPIAAWDVYKRGQDALQHMQALADVSQFPADGAQKWAELEQNIKAIDDQVRKLKATSRKGPAFQESWNRWLACGPQLDEMYHHVGEWKQGLAELSDHEDKEMDWEFEGTKQADLLKTWTDGKDIPTAVNWTQGISAAAALDHSRQDLEKWKADKPKNVSSQDGEDGAAEKTKDEWEVIGTAVATIQNVVMERQKIQEQLEWLKTEPASSSKAFTFVGVAFLVLAALCVAAVYMGHFDSTVGLGGAAACVVISVISLVRQSTGADRIPRKIAEIEGRLASVNGKIGDLAKEAEITLSTDESNERWLQELDAVRKQYLDWQTRETKNAWQKEQKVMYDAIYEKWQADGNTCKKQLLACESAWDGWRQKSSFSKLDTTDVAKAKEAWDTWHDVTTAASDWKRRKMELKGAISRWSDTAEQIFREVGVKQTVSPDAVEAIYKQWQDIRVQAEVAKEQDRQQKERESQIVSLGEERQQRVQQQQELLKATGAQSEGEFRSKVLRFRQFHQYKEVYDQTEAHIRLIAKTPKNLSELRHELKIHTLKTWTDERDYYQKKIADAEKKLAEVAEKRGSIIERLSQMAKTDEYGKLLQAKQNRKAELDRAVDDWLTNMYTQYMLEQAQEYYERVRQPVVIRQAGEYLNLMTQGRYTLQASLDGKQLFAVDGSQRRVPEKQWSSGLGDQIYLAIRISLAMAFSKQIEPMPLILDDILVRFDEQRQKEAIQFLASLGKKEQIFLFTCSDATLKLAEEVQKQLAGETDTIHLFEIEKGTIKELANRL